MRVFWNITHWCNYQCAYCGVPVFSRRTADPQLHAFDHYPPEAWANALRSVPSTQVALTITGGEPFVDRKNFLAALRELAADPRFLIQIHTNGSWTPEYFAGLDKTRIWLIISFHGSQTRLQPFLDRLQRLRAAGFTKGKVVMVLAPEHEPSAEDTIRAIEQTGWFVNATAMLPDGAYLDHRKRTERAVDLIEAYGDWHNAYFTIMQPPTRGALCRHPSTGYRIEPDGSVTAACLNRPQNLFRDGWPALPSGPVPCPHDKCYGCPDQVRSLVHPPVNQVFPFRMHTGADLMEEAHYYRARVRDDAGAFRQWLGEEEYKRFRQRALDGPQQPAVHIPLDVIRHAVPPVPLFGYIDQLTGSSVIDARAADRLLFSGWAASTRADSPVREVRLHCGDYPLAVFRDFYPRPEVVATFGRDDFLHSGWRGYCFLPVIPPGEYPLLATAVDAHGIEAPLPPLTLRIQG